MKPFYNNLHKLWQSHSLGYSTQNFWMTYRYQSINACICLLWDQIFTRAIRTDNTWFIEIYQSCKGTQIYSCVSAATSTESLIYPFSGAGTFSSDNLCCVEVYRTAQLASYRNIVLSYKLSTITHITLDMHGLDTTPLSTEFVIKAHQ